MSSRFIVKLKDIQTGDDAVAMVFPNETETPHAISLYIYTFLGRGSLYPKKKKMKMELKKNCVAMLTDLRSDTVWAHHSNILILFGLACARLALHAVSSFHARGEGEKSWVGRRNRSDGD